MKMYCYDDKLICRCMISFHFLLLGGLVILLSLVIENR